MAGIAVEIAHFRGVALEVVELAADAVDVGSLQDTVAGQRGFIPACALAKKENEVRRRRTGSASEHGGQKRRRERGGAC
jgi:hypothetical protein